MSIFTTCGRGGWLMICVSVVGVVGHVFFCLFVLYVVHYIQWKPVTEFILLSAIMLHGVTWLGPTEKAYISA
jgi:hypothetical protein